MKQLLWIPLVLVLVRLGAQAGELKNDAARYSSCYDLPVYKALGETSLIKEAAAEKADLAYRLDFTPLGYIPSERYREPPHYFIKVFLKLDHSKLHNGGRAENAQALSGRLEFKVVHDDDTVSNQTRELSHEEALQLVEMFHEQEVFNLPEKEGFETELHVMLVSVDNAGVKLERAHGEEYRAVDRSAPVAGPVAAALKAMNALVEQEDKETGFLRRGCYGFKMTK